MFHCVKVVYDGHFLVFEKLHRASNPSFNQVRHISKLLEYSPSLYHCLQQAVQWTNGRRAQSVAKMVSKKKSVLSPYSSQVLKLSEIYTCYDTRTQTKCCLKKWMHVFCSNALVVKWFFADYWFFIDFQCQRVANSEVKQSCLWFCKVVFASESPLKIWKHFALQYKKR